MGEILCGGWENCDQKSASIATTVEHSRRRSKASRATTTMGWTSSLQRLIPRQLSKKSIGGGTSAGVDKHGASHVEAADAFSPSFLAANMSSLCNEERILEETNNIVTVSSVRQSLRRQSRKMATGKNDSNNDTDSTASADDDDEDWQDDVILDPTAVPNNNHLMVNSERDKHYYYCSTSDSGDGAGTTTKLQHLSRCRYLDMLARVHAAELAKRGELKHSVATLPELQKKLDSVEVGENIVRGATLDEMHQMTMSDSRSGTSSWQNSLLCRSNILHPSYSEFGMGTARASNEVDGEMRLYMVQLFRQHDTWKNSFVPSSENTMQQQQLLQLQQQQQQDSVDENAASAPVPAHYVQEKEQHKQQQQHLVVESENSIMDTTSCCVHLCMEE
jgi:hypothetical protein